MEQESWEKERERNKSDSSGRSQRRGCRGRGLVCGCECSLAGCDELATFTSGYSLKAEDQEKARESVAERPRSLEERQAVILERWVELGGIKKGEHDGPRPIREDHGGLREGDPAPEDDLEDSACEVSEYQATLPAD